jgi:hypothetical protein
MACDRFASAITTHALGSPLGAEAGTHLAGCSRCQAALETERRVLATIDLALEDVGGTAASPNFLSRIRAHVEAVPPRWAVAGWRIPATAAALALLMLAAAVFRAPRDGSSLREASAGRLADVALQNEVTHTTDHEVSASLSVPKKQPRHIQRAVTGPSRVVQGPEILVPRHERMAVGRLFASLRAGRPETVSMLLMLRGGETASDDCAVTIAPLRIDPVVVSAMPASAFISEK